MAGDWIKIERTTPDKPEVWELASKLGIDDPDYIVGKLIRFWLWVDGITEDGQLKTSYAFIDRLVHCPGFAKSLATIGWLEGRDGLLSIPNYNRHNSQSAKARVLEAEAKQLRRNVRQMSDNCPTKEVKNVRPEKRREENSSTTPSHEVERFPKSIEEVEHFIANQVMKPLDAEVHGCASKFFDEMEAIGWRNKRGIPLDKWQPLARQYAANWARNTAESNFQGARSGAGSKNCNNGGSRKGNVRTDSNDLGVKWE